MVQSFISLFKKVFTFVHSFVHLFIYPSPAAEPLKDYRIQIHFVKLMRHKYENSFTFLMRLDIESLNILLHTGVWRSGIRYSSDDSSCSVSWYNFLMLAAYQASEKPPVTARHLRTKISLSDFQIFHTCPLEHNKTMKFTIWMYNFGLHNDSITTYFNNRSGYNIPKGTDKYTSCKQILNMRREIGLMCSYWVGTLKIRVTLPCLSYVSVIWR